MSNPTLKIKVLPRFPSSVSATSPITLGTVGGNYTIGLNANALEQTLDARYAQISGGGALLISQTTPNGGSVAGPIHLNSITVIDGTQTVTGSGDDSFGQIANRTDAFQVNYRVTGGSANHFAINGMADVTATNGGTVGVGGGVRVSSGGVITGNIWGGDFFTKIGSGSTLNQSATGIASEIGGSNTSTVRDRFGMTISTFGRPTITGQDAALLVMLDNTNGAPYDGVAAFANGIYFNSNFFGAATFPISGSVFLGDSGTATHLLNFQSTIFSGNLLSTPHVAWAGAGNLQINKTSAAISSNAAALSTTVADFVNVDGSPARLAVRGFGSLGSNPSYIGYTAGGTGAAPTQTLSGDGLVFVGGFGYSAADTAYNTGGGAGFLALATENFDASHGGAKLQVLTTPSGTKTQGVAGTFWGSQGLTIGSGALTDPGTGVVRVSSGYQIGNSAPTAGHVLRSDGAKFVDAQLAFSDLSVAANSVTRAMEAQGVARSVVGVTGNATANVADIQGTASQFLGVNSGGTALAFQTMSGDATLSGPAITVTKINGVDQTAAWNTGFTPTVTSSVGSFTTVSGTCRYQQIGKTVVGQMNVTITTAGTAAGQILCTLPVNGKAATTQICGIAKEIASTGKSGAAQISSSDVTRILATDSTGATFIATGTNVLFCFTYESV